MCKVTISSKMYPVWKLPAWLRFPLSLQKFIINLNVKMSWMDTSKFCSTWHLVYLVRIYWLSSQQVKLELGNFCVCNLKLVTSQFQSSIRKEGREKSYSRCSKQLRTSLVQMGFPKWFKKTPHLSFLLANLLLNIVP